MKTTEYGERNEIMLCNLRAEMVRRGLSASDISRVIGKTDRSARDKISGRYTFSIEEAKKVRDTFFPGMDLDFLFLQSSSSN